MSRKKKMNIRSETGMNYTVHNLVAFDSTVFLLNVVVNDFDISSSV